MFLEWSQQASDPMDNRVSFPRDKQPVREAPSVEAKIEWNETFCFPYAFMKCIEKTVHLF